MRKRGAVIVGLAVILMTLVLAAPATVSAWSLPGDIDRDCDVDLADLAILLGAFGTVGHSDADLDHDHDVDLADLQILLAHFGTIGCGHTHGHH